MKINLTQARFILLTIPLAIYSTELIFWFVMMERSKFPPDYNNWRGTIFLTPAWMIVFTFYLYNNSDKWTALLMTLFSPIASYIVVTIFIAILSFITWDITPFFNHGLELFSICLIFSYIIPVLLLFFRLLINCYAV
ncbi:hypothetical protein [Phytobacter diazotrophicus]|uniref:hypothetical protein n=1 Tax=Phytobacter diazotrophicus TaxID=395631 RepID=UPI002FF8D1FD